MKGILLAGGTGSRLWPTTRGVSKHLVPIYDKPLIYYPLSTLMLAGIRDIAIVTTPNDQVSYRNLLGDGSNFGINLTYCVQEKPEGIPQVFSLLQEFLGSSKVCLILGDNMFHGMGLGGKLRDLTKVNGAHIFGYKVQNPQDYGVIELGEAGGVVGLHEKPVNPPSKYAIPGLYFYDNTVVARSLKLKKSIRGEYEITDLNLSYLSDAALTTSILERGTMWLDCGSPNALLAASNYVHTLESRQGVKIAAIEEISWRNGWITDERLLNLGGKMSNEYGLYLQSLLQD